LRSLAGSSYRIVRRTDAFLPRLPLVMAEDGYLPRIFAWRDARRACRVAILACAILWAVSFRSDLRRAHSGRAVDGRRIPTEFWRSWRCAFAGGPGATVPSSRRNGGSGGHRCSSDGADDAARARNRRAHRSTNELVIGIAGRRGVACCISQ
jgi:hypothetical protein